MFNLDFLEESEYSISTTFCVIFQEKYFCYILSTDQILLRLIAIFLYEILIIMRIAIVC